MKIKNRIITIIPIIVGIFVFGLLLLTIFNLNNGLNFRPTFSEFIKYQKISTVIVIFLLLIEILVNKYNKQK